MNVLWVVPLMLAVKGMLALVPAELLRTVFRVLPAALPAAWLATVAVNTCRIIALVFVESVYPKNTVPAFHLLTGVAFFLPALTAIWYFCLERRLHGSEREP